MKRRNTAIAIALSLAIGGAGILLVEHVRAAGPPSGAITYTGFLENPDGTPVEESVPVLLEMFDQEMGGTKLCDVSDPDVQPIAGRFQIALPAACETAMKANANAWIQVSVGGVPVGRTQIGAVPYALEAGHSLSANSVPWTGITGVDQETVEYEAHTNGDADGSFLSAATPVHRFCALSFVYHFEQAGNNNNACRVIKNANGTWSLSAESLGAFPSYVHCYMRCF